MKIVGLVAAAGASVRMGFPKALLAPTGGTPLAVTHAEQMRAAGIERIACTLPPDDVVTDGHRVLLERLRQHLRDAGVRLLENTEWSAGLIGSVRSTVRAEPDLEGLLLAPVDVPACDSTLVRSLLAEATPDQVIAPAVDGRPGHPVLLPRRAIDVVMAFRGEGGVRAALDGFPRRALPWPDTRVLVSVDTPDIAARMALGRWKLE